MGKDDAKSGTLAVDPEAVRQAAHATTPFVDGAGPRGPVGYVPCVPLAEQVGADASHGAPAALGTLLCRQLGALRLVVIVKAAFSLESSPMRPLDAPPLQIADVHRRGRPNAHVVAASDMVPGRSRVDVTLLGQACAPGQERVRDMTVRLALSQGGATVLDKTLQVVGDGNGEEPFARMPITWERAVGGIDFEENPIGADPEDDEAANVVDPQRLGQPAGFGPIASAWPCRKKLLAGFPATKLDGPTMELPDSFDWRYFQAAPIDQQIDRLEPDATVLLAGLHPDRERIEASLPEARAVGVIFGLRDDDPNAATELSFRADTLHIDAERLVCTVTWRANLPVPSEGILPALIAVAGVELGGDLLLMPDEAPERPPAAARPPPAPVQDKGATVAVDSLREAPVSLPFDRPGAAPAKRKEVAATMGIDGVASADALPFGAAPAQPAPAQPAPAQPAPAQPAPQPAQVRHQGAPNPLAGQAPVTAPSGPALPASHFFHDLSKLPRTVGGEPDGIVPRAKDESAPPVQVIDVEHCATIAAQLSAPAADRSAILALHEVTGPAWRRADRHWRRAIEEERKRAQQELSDRYDLAYVQSWEEVHPGRFGLEDFHAVQGAHRRGLLRAALEEYGIGPALWMRLRKVWRKRLLAKPELDQHETS